MLGSSRKSFRHRLWQAVFAALLLTAGVAGGSNNPQPLFESGSDITFRLSEAVRTASAGEVIQLPEGVFLISATIRLRSGVSIQGKGAGKTRLAIAKNGLQAVFKASEREDIILRDMTIDGQNTMTKNVLIADDCKRVHVEGLEILDLDGSTSPVAIHLIGTTESLIENCSFTNISVNSEWGCAIRLSRGSSHNTVRNNRIHLTGRGGILCDNFSEHLVITGNVITGTGRGLMEKQGGALANDGLSIELWGNCGYSLVEDNQVDHWLSLDNSPYTAIRRNTISDEFGDDIGFAGIEAVGSNYIVVTDNFVGPGQYIGLSASNTEPKEYAYWGNNTVEGCQQWGAQFQGEEGFCRYQYFYQLRLGKTFKGLGPKYPGGDGHGFRFNDNCEFFVFEGGSIYQNQGAAIQMLGHVQDVVFIGMDFTGNLDNNESKLARMSLKAGQLPRAQISYTGTAKAGEALRFAFDMQGQALPSKVLWDFGAGLPSIELTPEFTYPEPGDYIISLIVWDENGLGGRSELALTITRE